MCSRCKVKCLRCKVNRLDRTFIFRGGWWERGGRGGGVTFSRGGGRNIYIKNKLKYEILYSMAKTFFCVITKNSNWEMLTKNSVAFKR